MNYKVRNVGLLPKNATSLKVQWSLECEAQKIVMKEYAIQYCEFVGPCLQQNYHIKSCAGLLFILYLSVFLKMYYRLELSGKLEFILI